MNIHPTGSDLINVESETVKQIGFGKTRIEALSDCIFAFAMTLLVISVEVPANANSFTPELVVMTVRNLLPDIFHYIIAFLLIAALWVIHHMQFHKIHYADHNLLWMTIGSLLFVALMPFSTDLVGDFPTDTLCAFIFELNLFITSALFYLQWSYAASNRHLIDPLMSNDEIRSGKQRAAVIPVFSLVGIVLAVTGVQWSTLIYLLAPVGFLLLHRYGRKFRGNGWGF